MYWAFKVAKNLETKDSQDLAFFSKEFTVYWERSKRINYYTVHVRGIYNMGM